MHVLLMSPLDFQKEGGGIWGKVRVDMNITIVQQTYACGHRLIGTLDTTVAAQLLPLSRDEPIFGAS